MTIFITVFFYSCNAPKYGHLDHNVSNNNYVRRVKNPLAYRTRPKCNRLDVRGNMWIRTKNGDKTKVNLPFVYHPPTNRDSFPSEENMKKICETSIKYAFKDFLYPELIKFENLHDNVITFDGRCYEITFWIQHLDWEGTRVNVDFLRRVTLDENFNYLQDELINITDPLTRDKRLNLIQQSIPDSLKYY